MTMVIPHLVVGGGDAAIAFYKQAFGAVEEFRMPAPDGKRVMHARLKIGDSLVMLADDFPEYCGGKSKTPLALGGTPVTIHIECPDVDALAAQAVAAGAKVTMPVMDMFWGARYGQVQDPFGHMWSLSTQKHELTPEQIAKAAEGAFAKADRKMQPQQ